MGTFDLVVIGAGSGGVRAARLAASAGKKVAICEFQAPGGTCVNVGCIPKKLLVYGSEFAHAFEDSRAFGWSHQNRTFNWTTLRDNKNREIERLNQVYRTLLDNSGVEFFRGKARIVDPNTVMVDDTALKGEQLLIATGGTPAVPQIPGSSLAVTSNEMFFLDQLPKRVAVIGAGYIAVEFACILNAFGSQTSLIGRGDRILKSFDTEVSTHLHAEMEKSGVRFLLGASPSGMKKDGQDLVVELSDGSKHAFDLVLMATGRVPNTQGLGLDACDVQLGRNGAIVVNDHYQTSVPSIFAIGDVIDRVQLTPVAIREAHYVVDYLCGKQPKVIDYQNIPTAVFSMPPIGTVGMTEDEARKNLATIRVYGSQFRALKHTLTGKQQKTFMKLIVDDASDRVVGLHMVGPDAAEITQGFAVAMTAGATKQMFDATVGIHPSAAEEFVTMRESRQ